MAHIDYYFATISPFTYLVGTRPAEIAAKHGATINYKPMDIMGLFGRTGGIPPKDRHPNRQEYRLQDMARRSKKLGMPLNQKPQFWPTNPAHIAQDDVIKACLEASGFDPALADSGLLEGADTYAQNLEDAVSDGAFGAPFFITGDQRFWGEDRMEDLDDLLAGKL